MVWSDHGFFDFRQGCLFQEVTGGSIAQRLEHAVGIVIHRQHNHLALRSVLFYTLYPLDARLARQPDIGKHDIQKNIILPLLKKRFDRMGDEQARKTRLSVKKINQHAPDLFIVFYNA